MASKQRALQWRRRLFWRRARLIMAAVVVVVGSLILYNRVIRPAISETRPTISEPATASVSTTSEESSEAPHSDPILEQLAQRVSEFETVFRSFNSSDPRIRENELAEFMTPDLLKEVLSAEHGNSALQEFVAKQGTRTLLTSSLPVGEFVDDNRDMAEFNTELLVRSVRSGATPVEAPMASQTTWVLHQGKWLVSEVDPL